jgi:3D (Asp-Asp-Asp) domain-containing protein
VGLILTAALLLQSWCQDMRITGYSRYEHSARTYDGTSIFTDEPIAAASWNIPIDSVVVVSEIGSFRVADRGSGLGSTGHIDIAVWSRAEAYALTGLREVCVYPPGGGPNGR